MKEDQHTEFKRLWKDEFFRELSAFANSQGGTLYIGVEDDGTIVGVKDAKSLLQDMPNKIKNSLGFLADAVTQSCTAIIWAHLFTCVCGQTVFNYGMRAFCLRP